MRPLPGAREACLQRALWRCERQGCSLSRWDGWSLHHRRPAGMGGSKLSSAHSPANLLVLCGSGVTGCHGWVESNRELARADGWLLRHGQDPELVPVPLWAAGRRPCLLDAHGGWTAGVTA